MLKPIRQRIRELMDVSPYDVKFHGEGDNVPVTLNFSRVLGSHVKEFDTCLEALKYLATDEEYCLYAKGMVSNENKYILI